MYILISLRRDIACHWNRNESFRVVHTYVVEKETSFVAAILWWFYNCGHSQNSSAKRIAK